MEVACEQALCLGKEWKNREESEGKGFSPRDFSTPSSNKELVHRLTWRWGTLGGVKNYPRLHVIFQPCHPEDTFQD